MKATTTIKKAKKKSESEIECVYVCPLVGLVYGLNVNLLTI